MQIDVLLFGPQAQLAGAKVISVELASPPATVRSVMAALHDAAPPLAPSLAASRLAINHAYASADEIVTPEDEVALIGMVSGG